MAILRRKIILGAKVEATKGTAETLTNSEAILVEDVSSPYTPEEVVRMTQRDTLSRSASIPGSPVATVDFRMEMKGGGAATTPPAWSEVIKGCGFTETVNTSDVTWALDSDDGDTDTLTIGFYNDGVYHRLHGARGNVSFEMTANQVCYLVFSFTGIYTARSNVAMLTTPSDTVVPPKFYNAALTYNFGSAWSTAVFSSLNIDMVNTVTIRENANATNGLSYAVLTDRDPTITTDLDRELNATAWLPEDYLETPTTGAMAWDVGSAAGNKISFSIPAAQIISRGDGDRDGVSTDELTLKARISSTGDDEITITQT